jgi:FkbM family methyltransferase
MGGQPFDLWLRTRAGDLFVLHEVLVTECYEIPRGLGIEPTMIVDLGANVGITTLYYARRFPAARFVCVEPDPANAALLRRNVDHLGDRVVVIEAAITARSGVVAFDDSGWSWGVQLRAGGAGGRAVAGLSMPDLMARIGAPSVDLVKIDIENGVAGLFEADRGWLARVRAMIVELVPDYPLERLAADVGPLGFEVLAEGSPVGNRMVMAVRRAGC